MDAEEERVMQVGKPSLVSDWLEVEPELLSWGVVSTVPAWAEPRDKQEVPHDRVCVRGVPCILIRTAFTYSHWPLWKVRSSERK